MSKRLRCEQCDGKGETISFQPCPICKGRKTLSLSQRERIQLQAVKNAAAEGRVFFLMNRGPYSSGWGQLRTYGAYISPCQKILKQTKHYILVEVWWGQQKEWYDRRTGYKRGVTAPPEKQRTMWRISPQSLEFINNA